MDIGWENLNKPYYKKGDLVFVSGNKPYSGFIKMLSQSQDEKLTWATHVGMIVTDGYHPITVEATELGVKPKSLTEYKDSGAGLLIIRPDAHHDKVKNRAVEITLDYLGRDYGYFNLALHVADALATRLLESRDIFFFRRFNNLEEYPICSWLVSYSYSKAFFEFYDELFCFGTTPDQAQPDDILDFIYPKTVLPDYRRLWVSDKRSLYELNRIYRRKIPT